MKKTYKLNPAGFNTARKRLVITFLIIYVIVIPSIIIISIIQNQKSNTLDIVSSIFTLAIILGVGMFFSKRQINMHRTAWDSYELLLDDHGNMEKKQIRMADIRIGHDEIEQIMEHPQKGIWIKTSEKNRFIFIPRQLDRYEELRSRFEKDIKLVRRNTTYDLLIYIGVMALTGAVFVIFYKSEDKIIVSGTGMLLLSLLIASLWKTQRTPQIDRRMKRLSWITLIPMTSIALKIILILVT